MLNSLQRIRKALTIGRYALQSPFSSIWISRDAVHLVLDRARDELSPGPKAPADLIGRFVNSDVTLPCPRLIFDGTQDLEGLAFLGALARGLRVRFVLEIGTFTGLTALTFAMNCPGVEVHTLDLPGAARPALEIERADRSYITPGRRLRAYEDRPEAEHIIQHEGDSALFDFQSLGKKFDLVYIDGAHSYDYVANDTRVAFSVVSDSGAIVWDDYYQRAWPGVVRYLNERTDLKLYRVPRTRLVAWFANPREPARCAQ
jgi:predicted O-methyltransferase YrrM